MQRLQGIVIGRDPQWPDRLMLSGEDGHRYVVRGYQRHWPQQAPVQCLTPGSAVTLLDCATPSGTGEDRIGDLRLPEHHPEWETLRELQPGQSVQVLMLPPSTNGRLLQAPGVTVHFYYDGRRLFCPGRHRRLLQARVIGVEGVEVQAELSRGWVNWSWRARWRARRLLAPKP